MASPKADRYHHIEKEEELKNKVARDFFGSYDCTRIIGHVDFSVYPRSSKKLPVELAPYLWAEAKKHLSDISRSITQLILTIGKERLFDKYLPPLYIGAFDAEKIAFVPYADIQEFFYANDFNWKITPSNHRTREFEQVLHKVRHLIDSKALLFSFDKDPEALKAFIREAFQHGREEGAKIKIDRNNFIIIYHRWLQEVKPSIAIDWEAAKKNGIIDGDFYLADLISQDDETLLDNLYVVLRKNHYELGRELDEMGFLKSKQALFRDGQKKYQAFWRKYERPPKRDYWDYIIQRRDLLVPQDIRERKGSFFTPQIWVELSQAYLAQALGETWQDEYYIWDCAAGTGNLLHGLVNKYRIWASTLDQQDVDTMYERIRSGANLLKDHVFQFDFLNDDWLPQSQGGKIPDNLYDILTNPQKQAHLVIYINPPYAEATTARTVTGTGQNKPGVTIHHKAHQILQPKIGNAANELFALFMGLIYEKLPNCTLALFSTLKFIQGSNFRQFREYFQAKFLKGFVVPAYTFDNVQGKFPIAFTIWNLQQKEKIHHVECDVYDEDGILVGKKVFYGDLPETINRWIVQYRPPEGEKGIGYLSNYPPDFQNQQKVFIQNHPTTRSGPILITAGNLVPVSVYFAVRHCVRATWLNDRDQFLYPQAGWEADRAFQADCVIFTLFHSQNKISAEEGENHWIPFREAEVGARAKYRSEFMVRFLEGKVAVERGEGLWSEEKGAFRVLDHLSAEARAVYEAGKVLWRHYHRQPDAKPDASLYDIRAYFQGRDAQGKVKPTSEDSTYRRLHQTLKEALETLAQKIADKAYAYGFLRR